MKRAAVLFLTALLALSLGAFAAEKAKPPLKVLDAVQPEYTAQARAAVIEGKVVLDLTVGETGKVDDVAVVTPLSHGLTEAAVEAARRWRFEAPKDGGSVVVRITLKFEL